jgi:acetyltransferase-like isoleucine patch superfamily enzyme
MSSKDRFTVEHRSKGEMRSLSNYLRAGMFQLLYGFVKYLPIPFANYLRFAVIRLFTNSFRSTYIADGVQPLFPWNIKVGRHSSLNQGVLIDGFGGVSIGDNVRIASNVAINTADHHFSDPDMPIRQQGYDCAPVVIENDVWIGTAAVICKGVRIGHGSVIGAAAVVTKHIPAYAIAVGVPARVIGWRKKPSEN